MYRGVSQPKASVENNSTASGVTMPGSLEEQHVWTVEAIVRTCMWNFSIHGMSEKYIDASRLLQLLSVCLKLVVAAEAAPQIRPKMQSPDAPRLSFFTSSAKLRLVDPVAAS